MRPEFDVVRDPLWDNIRLDRPFGRLVDTPTVQRLRYVRQLGHAFLVYPGATHSRFEHALGTFHLCRTALATLEERGELERIGEEQRMAVQAAALLHDIGH
ncbi:MAG TPA: HD domain-containing protein, partial [Gemmatimonadales bacterium]